jgi:DNA-binding transcriptional ArsR family regulator
VILSTTDEIFSQLAGMGGLDRVDWRILVGAIIASHKSAASDCPLPPLRVAGEFYYSAAAFAKAIGLAKSTVREHMHRLMRTGYAYVERVADEERKINVKALIGDARKTLTKSKNGRLVRRYYVYFVSPGFMELIAERPFEVASKLSELSGVEVRAKRRIDADDVASALAVTPTHDAGTDE